MTTNQKPQAEVDIDEQLVRRLLAEQCPDLADRRPQLLASGWDNIIFRLGDDLLVRLPRRQLGADLILNEQRWLPELGEGLPIPIPVPRCIGTPSDLFRWAWSVVDFVPGADGLEQPPDQERAVDQLGSFVRAMHQIAPPEAPFNASRGVPLADRAERTRSGLRSFSLAFPAGSDAAALEEVWDRALDAPSHEGPPRWLHGDLHPGNVVVRDGAIVSVIDFGDLTAGDPATDLGCAWMFFESAQRERFRTLVGIDDDTWDRARGWALSISVSLALNSSDNPRYEALALRTLGRTIADR